MKVTILWEQYALLEIFYNELDEDEESFLGNGSIKLLLEDWQICMYERTIWGHKWKECKNEASFSHASYWWDLVSILWTYWIQAIYFKQTS